MKTIYNSRQKLLVEKCERFHEKGINHGSLSGSLVEDLLITFLREDIKGFNFFKGQIRSGNESSCQIDIIICDDSFKQDEVFRFFKNYINVVPLENVKGVIEVKKWANPKMLSKKGSLQSVKNEFEKFAPHIPYMFVAFRFHDRVKEKKYFEDFNETNIDSFCFYGGNTGVYPWDEDEWDNFDTQCHYCDEYERLVTSIKSLGK